MILDGLKVIDFTSFIAGPIVTMLLGDMGANVIKVEEPHKGDGSRDWGKTRAYDLSALFIANNRNKRGIAIDLKADEGKKIITRMLEDADVVVESFVPGTAKKLGISYPDVIKINPQVIYYSLSGFGQTGPLSGEPGFDMVAQAYTGPMSVTGEPEGTPMRMGPSIIDVTSGIMGCSAITAALLHKNKTGQGQYVESSLFDCGIFAMNYFLVDYIISKQNPKPVGSVFPHAAPYGVFKAADGYFVLCIATDSHYKRFCKAADLENLCDDPRFATNMDRIAHKKELEDQLGVYFAKNSVQDIVNIANEARVPASPINKLDQIMKDPHTAAREAVVDVPGFSGIKMAGNPFKFSETKSCIRSGPPKLGEHTKEILLETGYNLEEVEALAKKGVIKIAAD